MKTIIIIILYLMMPVTVIFSVTNFLGVIRSAEPQIDIIVVEGEPIKGVHLGQIYEIVLGDEVYGKAKVMYIDDDTFDAKVIEGSTQEIHEVLLGKGELVATGFAKFYVLEPEDPQVGVLVYKSGNVEKIQMIEQLKEGFKVLDANGNIKLIAYGDLQTLFYQEEPKYRNFVKRETLIADVIPGFKEREKVKILEIKRKLKFEKALRLAKVNYRKKKFDKSISLANEAIEIYPEKYRGYFYKGKAQYQLSQYNSSINSLKQALQKIQGNKDLGNIEFVLAQSYLKIKNLAFAKQFLEKAFDHGKNDGFATSLLVEIELKAGRFNEALSTIIFVLKENKNLESSARLTLLTQAAKIYLEKQYNLEKASEYLNLAKRINSNDKKVKYLMNKILIEKSKIVDKEERNLTKLGGGWRTSDATLYLSFFEETIMLVVYRENPLNNKMDVILIGGDFDQNDDNSVSIKDPKTQKFQVGKKNELKFSQVKKLSRNFFSGDEDVTELDNDIVFKILKFNQLSLEIFLDGKKFKLVPMDLEE